ncbi:unnamed protein product [Meloidogyne enterolobii]|uniref:Uncharacterized protein n=1 Tax=Meloidogyne enterolobii TaxID=390850 RepID=A0ACB0YEJ7_MELEN
MGGGGGGESEVLLPYSIVSFFSLLFVALLMHTFLFLYILFPSFFLKLSFIDGDIYILFFPSILPHWVNAKKEGGRVTN